MRPRPLQRLVIRAPKKARRAAVADPACSILLSSGAKEKLPEAKTGPSEKLAHSGQLPALSPIACRKGIELAFEMSVGHIVPDRFCGRCGEASSINYGDNPSPQDPRAANLAVVDRHLPGAPGGHRRDRLPDGLRDVLLGILSARRRARRLVRGSNIRFYHVCSQRVGLGGRRPGGWRALFASLDHWLECAY